MRELSIEEKAKAYDGNYEAYTELINRLEDVKNAIKKQNYGIAMDILYKPYPEFQITTSTELKESKDEKIREWLIRTLKALNTAGVDIEGAYEMMLPSIAWLEKQGEHAKFRDSIQVGDKVTKNQDGVLVNLSQLNRVAKKDEKQGEQKSVIEMKTPEESLGVDSDTYNKIVDECVYGEQKPAWSEEDKEKLNRIYSILRQAADTHAFSTSCRLIGDKECVELQDFLKSLKERVQPQPKQEWSEEDESMLYGVIETEQYMLDVVNGIKKFDVGNGAIRKACTEELNFLKSLKERVQPQSQWKPSYEQMYNLSEAAHCDCAFF